MAGATAARRCAFRVLRRVVEDDAFADRAFRAEAERAGLDPRDRAFAQRLAYGAIQRRATLDHLIDALSDRPLAQIDPPLLDALRLGVFQLAFLDSVPDRAAVDQTVELAKEAGRGAAGFANAVMRRAAREARPALDRLGDSTPEEAALLHSHPEWVAQLWWEQLGAEEARALMARDNEPPELAVRVNTLVATPDEVRVALEPAEPVEGLPEALVLGAPFDVQGSELFASGALTPQSRASMRVARALDPQPGERVLDLCAAPGAKTTHLAALMEARGELVAVEQDAGRAAELAENCRRMRCDRVVIRTADAREPVPGAPFDRVLLDPPCSDLGTLQARPDARWRKTPEQVEELAALQSDLLAAAAAQLRPGGTLVYSTCTISPRENEGQVAGRGDLVLEEQVQFLPHREGSAGFFIAKLGRAA